MHNYGIMEGWLGWYAPADSDFVMRWVGGGGGGEFTPPLPPLGGGGRVGSQGDDIRLQWGWGVCLLVVLQEAGLALV